MGQTVKQRVKKKQGNNSSGRPPVWEDKMAEVKETFRRIAHVKPSGASLPNEIRSAPALSKNRRARIRNQVASKSLHVPSKVLDEMQNNRSQSPFISFSHLQNVLGMCRRIQSQSSVTERKKNPYDRQLYPVFVRRPASVNCFVDQNLDEWQKESGLSSSRPNSDRTPLTYASATFKPLYDISNGAVSGTSLPKRFLLGGFGERRTHHKPSWIHYKKVVDHPTMDEARKKCPATTVWSKGGGKINNALKKITRPLQKDSSLPISESWPSSNKAVKKKGSVATNSSSGFAIRKMLWDRRAHSESDLSVHSSTYFCDAPRDSIRKSFSSCSCRNGRISRLNELMGGELTNGGSVSDSWSSNSSSTADDAYTPRNLDRNLPGDGFPETAPIGTMFSISPVRPPFDTIDESSEHSSREQTGRMQDPSCSSKPRVKFASPAANDPLNEQGKTDQILSWNSSITWMSKASSKSTSSAGTTVHSIDMIDNFPPKPINFVMM